MLLLALCAAMSASPPDTVEALERLAPQARWVREPMAGLDAELVTLPTKAPNRFVVVRGKVAVATLEASAPLFSPLDAARANALVAAIERAELVSSDAPSRLRAAGFAVVDERPPLPRGAFSFHRLELRSPQSEPCVVAVRLGIDEAGRVERHEVVIARVAVASDVEDGAVAPVARGARVDRSAEIARFVSAARGGPR